MESVRRLDLAVIDEKTRRLFENLTEPQFQCCLRSEQPFGIDNTTIVAIGATVEGQPVGLVLATVFRALRVAEIHSLFVTEEYRNRKIGTRLLTTLQKELASENCYLVTFLYSEESSSTPFLEHILKELHWSESRLFSVQCRFDGRTFNPKWISREYKFPEGFQVFPWKELTQQDRDFLTRRMQQKAIPMTVNPFHNEESIEYMNSLGLRYRGEVIGWMITHKQDEETIKYSSLYIVREFLKQGPAIFLLSEAIRKQIQSPIPWAILEVNISQTELSWLQFIKKRLFPHAISVTHIKQTWKNL